MESSGTAGSWLDTKQTGHVSLQFTTRNDTGGTATCIVLTMFATSPNIRQQVMKPIFFPVSKYIYECVYIYICVCVENNRCTMKHGYIEYDTMIWYIVIIMIWHVMDCDGLICCCIWMYLWQYVARPADLDPLPPLVLSKSDNRHQIPSLAV